MPRPQTQAVPVLSQEDVRQSCAPGAPPQRNSILHYTLASVIVTDPARWSSFDDHMVHRGHAVFDTASIVNGMMYQLEAHLNRFERSASMARILYRFRAAGCARSS
jgi:4-amino-4-deoxychorismate lyase